MKSISELAQEVGVTPQAVYKKMNKQLSEKIKDHLHKGDRGQTLVDEEGQIILKESFKPAQPPLDALTSELTTVLQEQVRFLQEELNKERDHSRDQGDRVLNLAEQMADLTRNNQVLLKHEQERGHLAEPEQKTQQVVELFERDREEEQKSQIEKKGFFQRIFGSITQ